MAFDRERFRSVYPFESHWLDVNGLRLHYLDEGVGPPLLCVHGNPTWSFHFRALVRAFRPTQRVVVPDHVGCGLSDKPGDDRYEYVLERRVADLEALIESLDLRDITLVLHDWGGMIGLAAALRQRERMARLVLLNTAGFLLPAGKRLPRRLAILRSAPLLPALLVRGFNAFAWGACHMATLKGMLAETRAAYLAPYDSWRSRIATLRFVQDIPLSPRDRSYALAKWVDDHLHELRELPAMICWGAHDFVFDAAFLDEWRRRLPDAEVHTFADAGHYVMEDVPEQVIGRMRAFIARSPLQAARPAAEPVR